MRNKLDLDNLIHKIKGLQMWVKVKDELKVDENK